MNFDPRPRGLGFCFFFIEKMAEKGGSRRSVRQRIRDTKRLLSQDDLPETVRLTKERVLKCLTCELQDQQREVREKKMNKKYRMVKFFDKRKVMRRMKILQREICSCVGDEDRQAELLLSMKQLRNEFNYIAHYPPSDKYLALYPSTETTNKQAIARRDELLQQISEMVASGELPDASSSFLQTDLMTTPSVAASVKQHGSQSTFQGENDTICSIVGVPQANEQTRKRKRKIVYKAPVDEEPETKTGRNLACEDDFFLVDPSNS